MELNGGWENSEETNCGPQKRGPMLGTIGKVNRTTAFSSVNERKGS